MLSGNLDHDFLTHITVYCPLTDTRPFKYRESTSYDIHLLEEDFSSLQGFKNVIKERTRAGFLKSQFFRVTFDRNITDESHTFISDDDEILQAFDSNRDLPWQLIIVRYTKVQAARIRDKLKSGEQTELDLLTSQKRRYHRVVAPLLKEFRQDMNASIGIGAIYGPSDYESDSTAQGLECNIDIGRHPPSFLHTDSHMLEYGHGLGSLTRHHSHASSQDIALINRSPESGCIQTADSMVHEHNRGILAWPAEESPGNMLSLNEVVSGICNETPMGQLFSSRAIETWASEIISERHNSFTVPPPFFPIPDMHLNHFWRNVAVPIELQPIAMLYAKYLANKVSEDTTFSEEDYTDDNDISVCSDKQADGSNIGTDNCNNDGKINNLSNDDDEQINLL